ncbi:MAG: 50S ribosomal protein L6 [Myxococcota bacterium]
MATQEVTKQSRNGKKPVAIPGGVNVTIAGQSVTVKGPKGELNRTFRDEVVVSQENAEILVRPANGAGQAGLQFQGLTRALLNNMVQGVTEGYKRSLDFRGVGYRAEFKDGHLKMTVGLSHQPVLAIPAVVNVKIEQIDVAGTKFPRVHLESIDKEVVGRVAARIRSIRPPNPYGGKGVRYTGEKIREKAGKSGK